MSEHTRLILLTQGEHALVDESDYELLSRYKWHFVRARSGNKYAKTYLAAEDKYLQMHRLLTNPPEGMAVDHINGNGLDNRRANLRVCTNQQNSHNRKKQSRSASLYKGVSLGRDDRKWVAMICCDGKSYNLGSYVFERDAALVYDLAALKFFGEYARFNLGKPAPGTPAPSREYAWNSKLKDDQVLFIRASDLSTAKLAKMFGVSKTAIQRVKSRRTFGYVV